MTDNEKVELNQLLNELRELSQKSKKVKSDLKRLFFL